MFHCEFRAMEFVEFINNFNFHYCWKCIDYCCKNADTFNWKIIKRYQQQKVSGKCSRNRIFIKPQQPIYWYMGFPNIPPSCLSVLPMLLMQGLINVLYLLMLS